MNNYNEEFKLKIINSLKNEDLSISEIALKEDISRQTISRWIKLHSRFGEEGLKNKKPGAKKIPINHGFESLVLSMWKKKERSPYKMRKDLKKEVRRNGFDISERQIKRIYEKNNL